MKLTIVIPAHNEEEIIQRTIESLEEALNLDYEIIVVNDHSSDNTVQVIRQLMKRYANLKVIDNDGERGFANALRKGFSQVDSELVIPVMADLCDDPNTIQRMHEKSLEGFDIVCGSRYMKEGKKSGGPLLQSISSRFVGKSLKLLIGIPTCDVSNSFKCYRKTVLDKIHPQAQGFEISMELALKAYLYGCTLTEVPTVWKGRSMGKSKFYLFKAAPKYIKLYFWGIFKKWLGFRWQT